MPNMLTDDRFRCDVVAQYVTGLVGWGQMESMSIREWNNNNIPAT
jgi:hypothetical protein